MLLRVEAEFHEGMSTTDSFCLLFIQEFGENGERVVVELF